MCGIVGSIGESDLPLATHRGVRALRHRGPDEQGVARVRFPWASVNLGMARLAIVDRRQLGAPFVFSSCGVALAFNGEAYNWRALRAELSDGVPWETECDAEVIARGWRRWGAGLLDRLNGMFAFVLVDLDTSEVFMARDRAGEKPLFYMTDGSTLYFASEIKALPGPFAEAPCRDADVLEFDCLRETPVRGVCRLGPGEFLHLRSPADVAHPAPHTWWRLPTEVDEGMEWADAVDATEALLIDAVRLRVPDSVPWAVSLSGGLDSAMVQAIVRAERTYTVTFPADGFDNLSLAELAAAESRPVPVTFDLAGLQRVLPMVAYHLDTPATWTAVCLWYLAERMAADGVRVVLAGEGADELFGGYARYRLLWHLDHCRDDERLSEYGPLVDYLVGHRSMKLAQALDRSGGAALDHAVELVSRFALGRSLAEDMARVEWHTTMQVLLRMADRMFSAYAIENRSPFLDHRLVELAARMPVSHKITPQWSKAVLREVATRLGVSTVIVNEKTKRGLFVPWGRWCGAGGQRGAWDRSSYARLAREAWRAEFISQGAPDAHRLCSA